MVNETGKETSLIIIDTSLLCRITSVPARPEVIKAALGVLPHIKITSKGVFVGYLTPHSNVANLLLGSGVHVVLF